VAVDIARGLRARGYHVETWFLYKQALAYEDEPGVSLILPHGIGSPLDYLRIFWRLLGCLRKMRPHAVHGVLPLGNTLGLFAAWLAGAPVRVASQHSVVSAYHPVMRFLDKVLGTLGIYSANVIVSRAMRNDFAGYPEAYRKRLQVIQNGVAARSAKHAKTTAREVLGLPADVFLLGHLGRLTHAKNQEFLFELLARLAGLHLALAGEGENRTWYESLIAEKALGDRVHMLGNIAPDLVPEFLVSLDLFVMPSRFEGLPIALIEAFQAGLPAIVSDIEANREVAISDSGQAAALLLSTEGPEPWLEALEDLRMNAERRADLAAAAKRRGADFELERMVAAYESCFFGESGPEGKTGLEKSVI
jgi:glycosyltransferase involved in cell wall biosynthesis